MIKNEEGIKIYESEKTHKFLEILAKYKFAVQRKDVMATTVFKHRLADMFEEVTMNNIK